ncbi:hypothetical protein [Bartonella tamiae]|uniref:Uncharacterized protein n=1 Tax=Bartonella tamiae Th239 TaxID=1094558 RepID=J0R5Q0_9HYPH|nr:hypothetical protein [Bartonella tamiae]EJF91014.1 hypothetical protein ME5_00346 [Bartonella tamiae Th239]EJF93321.1 hypothetical protein MEG_01535 [Bartonella tamiae Th307]
MKKILAASLIAMMSMSGVIASNFAMAADGRDSFGDGSPEDSYVSGQKTPDSPEAKEMGTPKHFGNGSHEDTYVPGQKKDAPQSQHIIEDSETGSFDDGSPAE